MKKFILYFIIIQFGFLQSYAQINIWDLATETEVLTRTNGERYTNPSEFGMFKTNVQDLRAELAGVPHERQLSARNSYATFDFPLPDGSFRAFKMVEYDIVEAGLARKFPHIKAYTGFDDKSHSVIHLNLTKDQVFGVIREGSKTYYIDPYFRNNGQYYVSYDIKFDQPQDEQFYCGLDEYDNQELVDLEINDLTGQKGLDNKRGEAFVLKEYRLAVAATFGFTDFYGGTVQGALDGITTIVNRINSVFERDNAIRFVLIANNDEVIFTTTADDPFDAIATGDQASFLGINQTLMTSTIGVTNYDVGHVFNVKANSNSGQGIAQRPCACQANSKARGSSARPSPQGDAFTISIVCHEMGHQFNANHTMYHCQNVNLNTAYEPGSGTTIMSYAGICPNPANVQNVTDDYFHSISVQQIRNYSNQIPCGQSVDFGNTHPDAILDYPNPVYIPVSTPFKLEGNATDLETPDAITYCWEQIDRGTRSGWDDNPWDIDSPQGNEALFRSRPPVPEPYRYFPALPVTVNQSNYLFEQLPDYARSMKFRMTVRDNAPENGGVDWAVMDVEVIDNSDAGKFEITNFNVRDTILNGDYVEVTWEVADTDMPPINTECVDIYLSVDGGTSFPILVKSRTANDGSTYVNIPDTSARRFRFMVAAADNIYFDVSNRSGLLMPDSLNERIGLSYIDTKYQVCAPDVVELDVTTMGLGGYDGMIDLTYTGTLPDGASAIFTPASVSAGETSRLTVDLAGVTQGGIFDIEFEASGQNVATQSRTLDMVVNTANFSQLTHISPMNGMSGVSALPILEWNTVADALSYSVELSDVADFSNILFSTSGLTTGSVAPGIMLEAGGVYFWRVIPRNGCGEIDINRVSSFQVKTVDCNEFEYSGSALVIPGSSAFLGEMPINIGSAQTVDDINITQIAGFHQASNQLEFSLVGPDDVTVLCLAAGSCEFNNDLDFGFDDDAEGVLPDCFNFNTFNEGTLFDPAGSLSDFSGRTGSEFTLVVEDKNAGFGGRIDSWKFEICADASPEKPLLVNADSIHMPILTSRTVSMSKLEVTHSQYAANEITITIVEYPNFGQLLLDGVPIAAGAQMTMQDVSDNKLTYQHQQNFAAIDDFSFIATDPGGGFLGTPEIRFFVGISSTENPFPAGSEITLYPNPVRDNFVLKLSGDNLLIDNISVYTIQGKQVRFISEINSSQQFLEASDLAPGMYLVNVQSGIYSTTIKLLKQ